jgi:hypothetical protein
MDVRALLLAVSDQTTLESSLIVLHWHVDPW